MLLVIMVASHRRRIVVRLLLIAELLLVLSAAVWYKALYADTSLWEDHLVVDIHALLSDNLPRPTHAMPVLPGCIDDALVPHLPALIDSRKSLNGDDALVAAVRDGQRP